MPTNNQGCCRVEDDAEQERRRAHRCAIDPPADNRPSNEGRARKQAGEQSHGHVVRAKVCGMNGQACREEVEAQ